MQTAISPWTPCRVKFYKAGKGFGFAYRDENHKDIFIHASMLQKARFNGLLTPETPLEVRFIETPKGLNAIDIRLPPLV